jgi:hypothetical protein
MVTVEQFLAEPTLPDSSASTALNLQRIPWRPGSMRVVVTDLLFPGAPDPLLSTLSASRGRGVIFAPHCAAEDAPDWSGNLELLDCETRARRVQRVSSELLEQYRDAYRRHFSLWRERCRRHGVLVARVQAETEFRAALHQEALRVGAVELN